jgi:hypothetical protein
MSVKLFWIFGRLCSRFEIWSEIFKFWLTFELIFCKVDWSDCWTWDDCLKINVDKLKISLLPVWVGLNKLADERRVCWIVLNLLLYLDIISCSVPLSWPKYWLKIFWNWFDDD